MRLKVNILLLLFCFVFNNLSFSQQNDSIISLKLIDNITYNEKNEIQFSEMKFPFYDVDKNKIYVAFQIEKNNWNDTSAFISIEIKKKGLQQSKFKPLISKAIAINKQNKLNFIDSIDISEGLSTGNFDLIVSFSNNTLIKSHAQKIGFQTIRKEDAVLKQEYEEAKNEYVNNLSNTFVAKYPIEKIRKFILAVRPIAEDAELRTIDNIGVEKDENNIRQFFYNFWYNRNSTEPEKEWKLYADKLNYVAKKYGVAGTPGFETDRGKIYLIFGEPHTIDRRTSEKGALPYEVWSYYETNGRKSVKFLFYQPGVLSDQMNILHSTEKDVIINPYWKSILLKDPTDKDNKLKYRVFEYFN